MEIKSIHEITRLAEVNDKKGQTPISKYVSYSQRENIEKIEAYANSKQISGDKDSLGRDKPFFNIVSAAENIWYRATDIDRKDIRIKATKKSHYTGAFLATLLLNDWMRKVEFGKFLNKWGKTLARYGSAVVKSIEKNGELYCEVKPWNRMIVDAVDFDNNIKIEKLWLTPSQLRENKNYDQNMVEKLLDNLETRENIDGQKMDNLENYILIYEVHGSLPLSMLTGRKEDNDEYQQQMQVISYTIKKDDPKQGDIIGYDDYTLYAGKEGKDPFMITHLIEEDGRTMSIGSVEHLFEAQWMINHNIKSIKDQLDLASKIIFQTSDGNYVGQNALNSIENGEILIHALNQPLTQLYNKADISALQSYGEQWQVLGHRITGVSESMMGANPPSGTAWRQTQALLQESHSLFEIMTENKGLDIEKMLREYIIPHIKKKMDNTDEIASKLDEHQIKQLDNMFVPNQAKRVVNRANMEAVLSGNMPIVGEEKDMAIMEEEQNIQNGLNQLGNQRFIKPSEIDGKTWKQSLKDLEWEVECVITGESTDKQAALTTLSSVLQTLVGLGGQPMTEEMKVVFNKILNTAGNLSPVELNIGQQRLSAPQPAPQQAPTAQAEIK